MEMDGTMWKSWILASRKGLDSEEEPVYSPGCSRKKKAMAIMLATHTGSGVEAVSAVAIMFIRMGTGLNRFGEDPVLSSMLVVAGCKSQ